MNQRDINFQTIENFHKLIATAHVDIKGFYRFDISEIDGQFRSGVERPALLLEAPSSQLKSQTKMITNFNERNISFLIVDHAGVPDDYVKKSQVLADTEGIALDVQTYLVKCAKDIDHWLYGKFDINSVRIEKVGPIFDNYYGWNVLYDITSHESMCFVHEKWNF